MSAAPDVGTTRATADVSLAELPLRAELRGAQPYGAPQHDVPVRLNTNENPYPPSATIAPRDRGGGRAGRPLAEPLPGPRGLRAACGPRPLPRPRTAAPSEIWAANGSNEVMLHLLQAFAGPGRTVALVRPDVLDVSGVRAGHALRLGGWPSAGRLQSRPRARHRVDRRAAACRRAAGVAEQPDRYRAADRSGRARSARPRPAWWSSTRPTPSSAGPARRARSASWPRSRGSVVTRTMSKAFAFAGGRVGYLAAAPAVVDALRIVRLPYHLSAVTQATARVALAHADELLARVGRAARAAGRDRCVAAWPGADRGGLRRELRAVRRVR